MMTVKFFLSSTSKYLFSALTFYSIGMSFSVAISQNNVIITEIHFDPANDSSGDANGDGSSSNSEDEFVELVNLSPNSIDLSGWTISDNVQVRHTFPINTILKAGQAIVVFGGGNPIGNFGGAIVQTASNGGLSLNNGGDRITLSNSQIIIDEFDYSLFNVVDESIALFPNIYNNSDFLAHSTGQDRLMFSPGYSTITDLRYLNEVTNGSNQISALIEYEAATVLTLKGNFSNMANYKGEAGQSISIFPDFELEDQAQLELVIQKYSDGN